MIVRWLDALLSRSWSLCGSAVLLTVLWLPASYGYAQKSVDAEQQVRAQFVYNFANFVEWPDDAFADSNAPIKVCLFGEVDFAPYLYTFGGTRIGERTLVVQKADQVEEIRSGCHILYVGQDERVRLPTFWQEIQYIYVLSIGDRQGFADKGGIINILRTRDRVQFDVNIENALLNGLFLDSDLLALARVIKRNSRTGP